MLITPVKKSCIVVGIEHVGQTTAHFLGFHFKAIRFPSQGSPSNKGAVLHLLNMLHLLLSMSTPLMQSKNWSIDSDTNEQ